MYKSILVPLDGSTFSEHALPMALSIAKRSEARIVLTHVHLPITKFYLEGTINLDVSVDAHFKQSRQLYLDDVETRLKEFDVPVSTELLEGPISSTLAEYASRSNSDLVVMTTHGRDPVTRFWLGSVADELLRQCIVPMMLIHPSSDKLDLKSDLHIDHLMVALDGTAFAERMVSPAEELAKLMQSKVRLFRAIEHLWKNPVSAEYIDLGTAVATVMEKVDVMQAELLQSASEYLEKVAGPLREHGLRVETEVIAQDYPASAILESASANNCDAIAVETHGRHGLSRMILGSIVDKIVRGTKLPVLVHRPEAS